MSNYSNRVGIIGGGIAGLTLGCTFLKEGIPTIIFEQSSEASSFGAGISLSQNALSLLDRLNILSNLIDHSFAPSKIIIKGPKKDICELVPPAKILTLNRQELIKSLLKRYLDLGGEILYNHSFEDYDEGKQVVRFHNNMEYSIKHLAGCDGIHSLIRDQFFASNQQPKYSGYSAWRGVGQSDLKNVEFVLGPKIHIVSYPVNHQGDVSFVAVTKEANHAKESWKEEGSYQNLLDDFLNYDPAIFPAIDDRKKLYKWGIYVRAPLKSMVAQDITLLGDAAHPMVPFLGQGGCMAIEDAYSFGMLCKKAEGDFNKAQAAYDFLRMKRTNLIQKMSRMQANIYHMQNPVMVAVRNAVMKNSNLAFWGLKNIHEYDAHSLITKTHV